MSGIPTDWRDQLDIREQIARIDRHQAEIDKLFAEQSKLRAEEPKLRAEEPKLRAEARKYRWDPFLVIAGMIVAAIAVRLPEILGALK
jgi:hypothetical protein